MPINTFITTHPAATSTANAVPPASLNVAVNTTISNSFYSNKPFQLHPDIQNSTLLETNTSDLRQLPPQLLDYDPELEEHSTDKYDQPSTQIPQPKIQVKAPLLYATVQVHSSNSSHQQSPTVNYPYSTVTIARPRQPLSPKQTNYQPLRLRPLNITLPTFNRSKANHYLQQYNISSQTAAQAPTTSPQSFDSSTTSYSSSTTISNYTLNHSPIQSPHPLKQSQAISCKYN